MTIANFRKCIALALVIALTLLPMVALAEGTESVQVAVTIGNFDIAINDDEPVHIDASLRTSVGFAGDSFRYENEIASDGKSVARLEAALRDGALLLTADGLTSAYRITLEELQQLMQVATTELPFDMQLLQNFIEAYVNLLQVPVSGGPQNPMAMFEKAGIPFESKPESAEVMGEMLELTRYDFELHTADFDKLIATSIEEVPELKAYMDAYIDLIAAIAATEGTEFPIDKDHMIESMMSAAGGDISMKCALWTDESGENLRMEFTEIIATEDDGESESIEFPFVLMQKTDADGTVHMQMDMDVESDDDEAVSMSMLMNTGADKGDMTFAMSVQDDEELTNVSFDMNYDQESFQMTLGADVPEDDDVTNVLFSMGCKASGDAGRIELGLAVGQGGEPLFSGSLGFDVMFELGEFSDAPLLADGKPVINISEMTEEQLAAIQSEGTMIGFTSLGTLMANPGIAKIITDITNLAQSATGSDALEGPAAAA